MSENLLAPRAQRELREAVLWIAEDNLNAALALRETTYRAARMIVAKPGLARTEPELAPPRFRFWSPRAYPYLLVLDTGRDPPVIARFLHQARDLPSALAELLH